MLLWICFPPLSGFASRILSSVSEESEIKADRRTPPTTTISAILQTISWTSMEVSLRPADRRKVSTVNRNRSSSSGPDARPPNVLSLAPAGRTLDKSHFGTLPLISSDKFPVDLPNRVCYLNKRCIAVMELLCNRRKFINIPLSTLKPTPVHTSRHKDFVKRTRSVHCYKGTIIPCDVFSFKSGTSSHQCTH